MRRGFPSTYLVTVCFAVFLSDTPIDAREPDAIVELFPDGAPGESTRETGTALPRRENENPPATRIGSITHPRMFVYLAPPETRNGTMILIFPGGGYNYVVADKEGTEAAEWLNSLGISAAVVHYRTKLKDSQSQPLWIRPLQDAQRAVRLSRHRAEEWGVNSERVGVLGFSAGGQAGAFVTCRFESPAYEALDDADQLSCRPDFAMLLYPWQLLGTDGVSLRDELPVGQQTPPIFFVHTHDDGVTSLSSIALYQALKQNKVEAELHIYRSGGHGYGMRPVDGSEVDTWPARAADWLRHRGLLEK